MMMRMMAKYEGTFVGLLSSRFFRKTVFESGGCWTFVGSRNPDGYGRVYLNGRIFLLHRLAKESLGFDYGEGMDGVPQMVSDHLCRNRSCWNPEHIEVVTSAENCYRGVILSVPKNRLAGRKSCLRGHPFPENLAVRKKASGAMVRTCRECNRLKMRRYYLANRRRHGDYMKNYRKERWRKMIRLAGFGEETPADAEPSSPPPFPTVKPVRL